MNGAVSAALVAALCGDAPPVGATAAGRAIAEAVTAHAATFAPASEPAYHDQHHQAEAAVVMGWLCAKARQLGQLEPETAVAGVLAMAGHDLQHDGSWPTPGALETRSAELTVELAARAGLDAAMLATIRRAIIATDPFRPQAELDADDLVCRLAEEADVFGSLTPELGWTLSNALAREMQAAGHRSKPSVASFSGHLALLRRQRPVTRPGQEFGLADAVADQIAAMAVFGDGNAEQGAVRLDALPPVQARADYLAALAAAAPK
jgi:hypothetical protein